MNEYLQARIARLREQADKLAEHTAELVVEVLARGGSGDESKRR